MSENAPLLETTTTDATGPVNVKFAWFVVFRTTARATAPLPSGFCPFGEEYVVARYTSFPAGAAIWNVQVTGDTPTAEQPVAPAYRLNGPWTTAGETGLPLFWSKVSVIDCVPGATYCARRAVEAPVLPAGIVIENRATA